MLDRPFAYKVYDREVRSAMMKTRVLLASSAALLAMAVPASAAHAKSCPGVNSSEAYNMKTKHVSCKKAKKIEKKYNGIRKGTFGKPDHTPYGFKCRRKNKPQRTYKVTCTKRRKLVSWYWEAVL